MNRFNIGRRIESYRDRLGMSTQELAERINRSQATVSRIENGKQGLTFELLSRLATELRVHPFALLSDEPVHHSVLMPLSEDKGASRDVSLLANALQAGRLRCNLRLNDAAESLAVTPAELEAIETGQAFPDDSLLARLCDLYGLPLDELQALRQLGASSPKVDRSLAYLQRAFSRVYFTAKHAGAGEERAALDTIVGILDKADGKSSFLSENTGEEVGLFLHRLSFYLVKALQDREFRDSVLQLASMAGHDRKVPEHGGATQDDGTA